uniref:Uncharacterized protein n=1 Tax=Heliothis virescens TaxID=7102 RepID=A0A2A4K1B3_HELVI
MWAGAAALLALLAAALCSDGDITVISKQLTFDDTHELEVNSSVEYILSFAPNPAQGHLPIRVWVQTEGGDTARPLLVTARRTIGAWTWQLPYRSGPALLHELQRTLCPDDSVDVESLGDNCEPAEGAAGALTLHVSSSCAAPARLRLRAAFVRDWLLPFQSSTAVEVKQGAPSVHAYRFPREQEHVRLVVDSRDDVCATVAVQDYSCPIAETLEDIEISSLRMTVTRSGGMQLSRQRYPRGFYVVAVVHASDAACRDDDAQDEPDWLWSAALAGDAGAARPPALPRRKALTLHMRAALSRAQYAAGAGATLALLALVYAGVGALVLAQRLPRLRALVAPRAVLAAKPDEVTRSEIDSTMSMSPGRRRRRDSTATFDSSDNSDTDEEEETGTATTDATGTRSPIAAADVIATADVTAAADVITTADVITAADAPASGDNHVAGATGVAPPPQYADDSSPRTVYVIQSDRAQPSDSPPRPFGLPPRLHVAALARRRARVLAARSDRYLYTLYTVGLFYALPVLQFVAAFQVVLNVTGSLDVCYYNFLCAHPLGGLSDFNHVFSNVGYLLLGALFMLQVRRRKLRRRRKPRHEEYGIPAHYGLLSSLGAAMMMVALLSASYHVCPNALNFQFDTAFMYVLAVLSMVKIYQARHPDINARAHATFGVLALLIALVVWGVVGGGPLFWSVFTVLHVFTFLLLSLRIYYVGQFRLEKQSVQEAVAALPARGLRPLYAPRLVMLLIGNAVNWAFALYGLFTQSADFAGHLLSVLLCNTLLYMVFYLSMKLLHGERPRWYAWLFLGAGAATWVPALYFFVSGSSDWSATPAQSRERNHECRVLQFYDAHDLWHLLSALALYFSFNALLTWDDGLAAVKRTDIAVF